MASETQMTDDELDQALAQMKNGAPFDPVAHRAPDVAELLSTAQRLQTLAPAPKPRLDASRRRFLQAAQTQPGKYFTHALYRPALAVIVVAALVLIVGGMLMSVYGHPQITPTAMATRLATPTKTAMVPINTTFAAPMRVTEPRSIPEPKPVPTPTPARPKILTLTKWWTFNA